MRRRSFLQTALAALASVFGLRTKAHSGLASCTSTGWSRQIDPNFWLINTRCEPCEEPACFPGKRQTEPSLSSEAALAWLNANFAALRAEHARYAEAPGISVIAHKTNVDTSGKYIDGEKHIIQINLNECRSLDDFASRAFACAALLGRAKREKIQWAAKPSDVASVLYLENWPFTGILALKRDAVRFSERGGALPLCK